MSEIMKICKIHGELTIDQVRRDKQKEFLYYRCKICERKSDILSKRKISSNKYDELVNAQNGLCAICQKVPSMKNGRSGELMPLAVDHCHKCLAHIRGLLCMDCNTAIGKAKDSIAFIKAAITYLESHTHV